MTETGDNPSREPGGIERFIKRLTYKSQRFAKETDLKLDSDAVAARELLNDVGPHLGFLSHFDNQPKVLEVKTPSREYVSIRRLEGSEMENKFIKLVEPPDKDHFATVFNAYISPDSLDEGQILVFDTPVTFDGRCKKPEVAEQIEDAVGDRIDDFANFLWLAMMSDHPELYKAEDWEPSFMSVVLVTKRGGKLFYGTARESQNTDDKAEVGFFRRLKIEKDGKAEILLGGYFQCETDKSANVDYLRKYGRIYLLTEGSSEKERATRPLTELKKASSFQSV